MDRFFKILIALKTCQRGVINLPNTKLSLFLFFPKVEKISLYPVTLAFGESFERLRLQPKVTAK